MRVSTRTFFLSIAALACLAVAGMPAQAQIVQLEGRVLEANTKKPISGATVDIYRTDQKGKYEAKTDAEGRFTYPVPGLGTYTLVVAANGRAARFVENIRPASGLKPMEFTLDAGDGARPSLDDIKRALASGGATSGPTPEEVAEYERQLKLKEQFDSKKTHFDTGVKALESKNYPTAISELTAALEGLDENSDVEYWGELMSAAGGNLAEVHYRVAVDRFNAGSKDEAKSHLEQAARAINIATKGRPAEPVNYSIQGKVLHLLVERYGMTDQAEAGATAFIKAGEAETTDKKAQAGYFTKAGDVYRAAYETDKAIETYKRALAVDPNNAQAMYGIGLAAMSTAEENEAKRRAIYQTAADYLNAFIDKAGSDSAQAQRVGEAKAVLATLASDFKIKPKSLR